ncbi:acyltransferase [Bacillus sp. WLY-B-L8]|uniref:acyltransferase n=1 Tax=Bacillus multifaciens TaxID=3068506 RepID=UPI0035318442
MTCNSKNLIKPKKIIKNSNIEFIRIISMIFIIFHHYSVHSGWVFSDVYSKRQYFIETLGSFGKIGVILFVMISGYFLKQSTFKIKKLISMWGLTFFYSISIYLIFLLTNKINLTHEIWKFIFPLSFSIYWFVTIYTFIYILTPIFKKILLQFKQKQILIFLFLFVFVCRLPVVIGLLTSNPDAFSLDNQFLFIIFITAGYLIREYEYKITASYNKYPYLLLIITTLLILIGPYLIRYINYKFNLSIYSNFFVELNSINALLFSVSLFIILSRLNFKSRIVNSIGACTFGVYLIHDNPFIRKFIWIDLFHDAEHLYGKYIIISSMVEPVIIFLICVAIELLRKKILTKVNFFIHSKAKKIR